MEVINSTKTALSSQQRVNRTLNHQDVDRIPRYESFWPETLDRWMTEGLQARNREEAAETVRQALLADMHSINWFWPNPFPGQNKVLEEDDEIKVVMGESGSIERMWKNKSGTPEHLGWDCDSREKWEKEYKPRLVDQPVLIDLKSIRTQYAIGKQQEKWNFLAGVEGFECIRKLIGDEEFMYTILDEPEWILDMAETETDVLLRNYQAVIDDGIQPDGVWIYGDMAFNSATFCSPATYRELIWPSHKRIADWIHANGMKMIFHSDGDLRGVIDLYVEAGFDCIQPLEAKASMDLRNLVPQYGDKLGFFGNIDVMKLITNDLDVIEEEVRVKLAAGMQAKGYIYHSDHSIPPQVSWQTYQTLIEMVDRYGVYP